MSITIAEPSVEERIRRHVESGRFSEAGEVVAHALDDDEAGGVPPRRARRRSSSCAP